MPYYLVMQTSLVEADEDVAAAEQVLAKLQDAQEVTFTVKLDESNISHVIVQRNAAATKPPESIVTGEFASSAGTSPDGTGSDERAQLTEPSPLNGLGVTRSIFGFALFLLGALVGIVGHKLLL